MGLRFTLFINIFCDAGKGCTQQSSAKNRGVNITKNNSLCRGCCGTKTVRFSPFSLTFAAMLESLMKKWKVSKLDLVLILCVFAVTGTTTAYVARAITSWAGFTDATHWAWKLLVRLGVLIFGYQIILLCVAFLFGQFSFFWRFEKKLLSRMGMIKKETTSK
jgi:hypothetical protein